MAQMRPLEYESWKAYLEGCIKLPNIDWEMNQDITPVSEKALKRARRRAEALNRLYGTDKARPSHSTWFARNHIEHLPLVKAMARVISIERHITGGHNRADGSTLADLQTIKKVISSSIQIHRGYEISSRAYKQAFNRKLQVLVNHQRELQRGRRGSQKRRAGSLSLSGNPSSKRIQSELGAPSYA
jgi:hypothetical protein